LKVAPSPPVANLAAKQAGVVMCGYGKLLESSAIATCCQSGGKTSWCGDVRLRQTS